MFEIIDNDYKLTQLQDAFRLEAQDSLRDIAINTFNTHTYAFCLQRLKDANGFKVKFMVRLFTFKVSLVEGEKSISVNYCIKIDGKRTKPNSLKEIEILHTLIINFMKALYKVERFYRNGND